MSWPADRWAFSENAGHRPYRLLAASLLLLGAILPTSVVAAPRDDDSRVVPTKIHDRARAEGEVRVLVELALPSSRVAEGAVPSHARAAYRQEITDTASRLLSRLTQRSEERRVGKEDRYRWEAQC